MSDINDRPIGHHSAFGGFLDGITKINEEKQAKRKAAELKRLKSQMRVMHETVEVLKKENRKLKRALQYEKDTIAGALV